MILPKLRYRTFCLRIRSKFKGLDNNDSLESLGGKFDSELM